MDTVYAGPLRIRNGMPEVDMEVEEIMRTSTCPCELKRRMIELGRHIIEWAQWEGLPLHAPASDGVAIALMHAAETAA